MSYSYEIYDGVNATANWINVTSMSEYELDFLQCPAVAPLFGFMGAAAAIVLSNVGAAYGTSRAGVGIMMSGISAPELLWQNLIPVIMAGVNAIYGLITAIMIINDLTTPSDSYLGQYSLYSGFAHLNAGLCVGLAALASGVAIGIAGDAGTRSIGYYDYFSKKYEVNAGGRRKKKSASGADQLFVSMVLIQVFAGNLALYGLITAIILLQSTYTCEY